MRRFLCAVIIGILLSACAGVLAAEKAETNPAEQAAETIEVSQDVDTRLAEKVTYNGGYKRLREVVEDISAMTGVTIRCGRTDSDWQSRDIPVFISVTDMPLGRLLNLLADCTHQGVFARHIGANEPATTRTYRIYRDNRRQADLDAYQKAQDEAAERAWDTLVKFANTPESQLRLRPELNEAPPSLDKMMASARAMGQVLAYLGESGKKSVLAGNVAVVRGDSVADTTMIRDLYMCRMPMGIQTVTVTETNVAVGTTTVTRVTGSASGGFWRSLVQDDRGGIKFYEPEEPSNEDVWSSVVAVQLSDFAIETSICATVRGKNCDPYTVDSSSADRAIRIHFQDFGEPPGRDMIRQELSDVTTGGKYRFLIKEEDWDQPVLQTKVEMRMPEDRKPTLADTLKALSEATGFSVIAEDFQSHLIDPATLLATYADPAQVARQQALSTPNEETLGNVLKKLTGCHWAVDADNKQIIGLSTSWRQRHLNLVPQSLLMDLERKLQAGASLEDVAPVLTLTPGQMGDWVSWTPNLRPLEPLTRDLSVYWKLYGYLSDRERSLAKSTQGLPLNSIDGQWLSWFLSEHRKYSQPLLNLSANEAEGLDGTALALWASSDPAVVSSLTMKVKGRTVQPITMSGGKMVQSSDKTAYKIELVGEVDGSPVVFDGGSLSAYFPIHAEGTQH